MLRAHRQPDRLLRVEWGPEGARAISPGADVAVVVDVLSFTTALSVAVDAGIEVFPHPRRDESAVRLATETDSVLAVGRSHAVGGSVSLSPITIRRSRGIRRLVLPSPNGSTIAAMLASTGVPVVGASLRNAGAVAGWIRDTFGNAASVAVVAAGERWPDGSLRPAVEDLWGAGAVLAGLAGQGPLSPEVSVAVGAWNGVADDVPTALAECASGQELVDMGFRVDVDLAAEVASSTAIPLLQHRSFVGA